MKRFFAGMMLAVMLFGFAQPAAAYPWIPSGFPPVDYRPPNYNTPGDGYDDGDYFDNDIDAFMCLMVITWAEQLAAFASYFGPAAGAYEYVLDMMFEFDPDCYFYYYYGYEYDYYDYDS